MLRKVFAAAEHKKQKTSCRVCEKFCKSRFVQLICKFCSPKSHVAPTSGTVSCSEGSSSGMRGAEVIERAGRGAAVASKAVACHMRRVWFGAAVSV